MNHLLEIEDLTIDVTVGREARRLVDGVSLHVDHGSALAIVGESGSGKTLTCRAVLGSLPRRARVGGRILLDGRSVLDLGRSDLRRFRSTEVALIAQDPHASVNPVRTIGSFLTELLVDCGRATRAQADARASDVLASLGFADPAAVMTRFPHELSGGMLQRVVIGAAMLAGPRLIVADESTSALDVTNQAEVARMLMELCRLHGVALVFVSHDLDLAASVCDRVAVMHAGRLLETQSSTTIYATPAHPYTAALAACRPAIDAVVKPLPVIPADVFARAGRGDKTDEAGQ